MIARLLLFGMVAGVVAGTLAFALAKTYGEPQVEWAISYEDRTAAAHLSAHGHDGSAAAPTHDGFAQAHTHDGSAAAADDDAAPVDRATQSGLGLFIAVVVFAASVGGIFALVFAASYGRFAALGPRATAAVIAAAAFVAVALVPQLKYPASPPAVGTDATIATRTLLFFGMIVLSVAITALALFVAEKLRPSLGAWNAAIAAGAAFLVLTAAAFAAMPTVQEVPADFSAVVLWNFRIASLAMHAVIWTTLGLLLGAFAERELRLRR